MDAATSPSQVRLIVGAHGFTAQLIVPAPAIELAGLSLIEYAVRAAYQSLPSRTVFPPGLPGDQEVAEAMHFIVVRNGAGAVTMFEDDDLRQHEWLADLLIAAEILPPSAAWLADHELVTVRFPSTRESVRMPAGAARAAGLQFHDDPQQGETHGRSK